MTHYPPVSQLAEDHQPPRCPHWCTSEHEFNVHAGEMHVHDGLLVRLLQGFGRPQARIYVSAGDISAAEAPEWAHTFAILGHAELAATIKRLGELAEADAAFTRPQPGARHEECTIGAQPGVIVNPAGKLEQLPVGGAS